MAAEEQTTHMSRRVCTCALAMLMLAGLMIGAPARQAGTALAHAAENTQNELPDHYITFEGRSEWDVTANPFSRVELGEEGITVYAGKTGDETGTVSGVPAVEIQLIDTGIKALRYPYIALRIKSSRRDLGGRMSFKVGSTEKEVRADFAYADTGEIQTVTVDLLDAINAVKDEDSRKGTYRASIKIYPFGASSGKAKAGDNATIESVAFFKNAGDAEKYSGTGSSGDTGMEEQKWLAAEFSSPSASYRMMKLLYNFDTNYKAQVDRLYNGYGYGGITTNVAFNSKYLKDPDQFRLLDDGFAAALSEGMSQLWIYDEYQWPSGSAYGMVTKGNPEYEPYGLAMLTEKGSGSRIYQLPDGYSVIKYATLTAAGQTRQLRSTDKTVEITESGSWTLKVWATYDAWVERDSLNPWQKGKPYVNIMSKGAIAKFISLTHEKYKEQLSQSFGSVEAFFTDEPSLFVSNMTNPIHTGGKVRVFLAPWEDSVPEVFEQMHGYSIFDHLESLYGGDSDEDFTVRVNYAETVAKLISENYFGQLADWCAANGANGSGHLLLEEKLAYHVALYGNFLTCMNRTGYAGCDLLQVSPERLMDSGTYVGSFVAIKMASSSARNTDKEHVLVEFNPEAVGDTNFKADPFGTSFAGAVITRMYGADKFVMLNPQESYNAAQTRALNDAVGRINVLLEGAKMNSGVGVYYPIASVQGEVKANTVYEGRAADISEKYNELCLELLKARYDYNYIDDESILAGTVSEGKLECGRTSYRVIVMALTRAMDPAVLAKLNEFAATGGKLIWVDGLPSISTVMGKTAELEALTAQHRNSIVNVFENGGSFANLKAALDSTLSYGFSIGGDAEVLTSTYVRDGRQIIVAVNSSSVKKQIRVSFGGDAGFDVYDLYSGQITEQNDGDAVTVNGYRAVVLVSDRAQEPEVSEATRGPGTIKGGKPFPAVFAAVAGGIAVLAGAGAAVYAVRKKKNGGNKK